MRSGSPRYVIGGILIGLGVLLLLSNTDVINLDWVWNFVRTWWPVLLIVWGLWELVSGGFRFRLWPIILLLLGIGFQLSALNLWEWDFKVVWPVFIVIIGLAILLGRQRRRDRRRHHQPPGIVIEGMTAAGAGARAGAEAGGGGGSGEAWRAVFNSIEERYEGREFRGGEVESNFGNVALDLREATLAEGAAHLEVNLAFGGLHLRLPRGWRVNTAGVSAHFGHVQDQRTPPEGEAYDGELTIAGTVTFGNIELSD